MVEQTYLTTDILRDTLLLGNKDGLSDLVGSNYGDDAPEYALVTRAVDQANSYVDTYIGSRYTLPLSEIPAILTNIATRIAIYNIITMARPDLLDDIVIANYESALAELTKIKDGEIRFLYPDVNREESLLNPRRVSLGSGVNRSAQQEFDCVVEEY